MYALHVYLPASGSRISTNIKVPYADPPGRCWRSGCTHPEDVGHRSDLGSRRDSGGFSSLQVPPAGCWGRGILANLGEDGRAQRGDEGCDQEENDHRYAWAL